MKCMYVLCLKSLFLPERLGQDCVCLELRLLYEPSLQERNCSIDVCPSLILVLPSYAPLFQLFEAHLKLFTPRKSIRFTCCNNTDGGVITYTTVYDFILALIYKGLRSKKLALNGFYDIIKFRGGG